MFFLRYLTVTTAIAAALYSLLLTHATHLFALDTQAFVTAAVRLVPYNAAYTARLAAWQPAERHELLHRAVKLNPWDFQSWIQLGLSAEMQHNNAEEAEQDYLRAAAVNHMFLPKWTLTNFYFRQRRSSDFFHWANAALQITPYYSDPIFAQMWLVSQDAATIAAAVPDRRAYCCNIPGFYRMLGSLLRSRMLYADRSYALEMPSLSYGAVTTWWPR